MNSKSDVNAKIAFKKELETRGYSNVRVIGTPADIRGELNGQNYLFEVKFTASAESYFGAATITEWEAALQSPTHFRFVIARVVNGEWDFREYTPEEFLQYSEIPPFKVYFRVPLVEASPKESKKRKAVVATVENLQHMIAFRARMKDAHDKG